MRIACRISKPLHLVCNHGQGLLASLELACLAGTVSAPLTWRDRLIGNRWMQRVLRLMVVVAVGAIMGDGVLTPAISGAASISFPVLQRLEARSCECCSSADLAARLTSFDACCLSPASGLDGLINGHVLSRCALFLDLKALI